MDQRIFRAPGRVNLIGEHTDYTGGYVLPMAIPFTTAIALGAVQDGAMHFASADFAETRAVGQGSTLQPAKNWTDYPVGVLAELRALGVEPPPVSLSCRGDVPLGAGLSSSASIEVATAVALLSAAGAQMTAREIALLCQRAENRFVGSPCGIMDQTAITAAHAGHALLIRTRELTWEHLPMNSGALGGCVVLIANSRVKHSVAAGEYGVIRAEMEAGQTVLRDRFSVRDLADATLEQLQSVKAAMSDASFRRCRHVISENARVLEAREAMLAGDAVHLGDAMTRSHNSQRDDLGTSVEEIDFLVEAALALPGCHGARLTGGGFGGCTVNLVEAGAAGAFAEALANAYEARYGLRAETYTCAAADGALRLAAAAGHSVEAECTEPTR